MAITPGAMAEAGAGYRCYSRSGGIWMHGLDPDSLSRLLQEHFTDGLVIVVGSGLSVAEGMPGMRELAEFLNEESRELKGDDAASWDHVAEELGKDEGLEAALLKHPPSEPLEAWIAGKTAELLLPREREVMASVVKGEKTLRLTDLLRRILKPPNGLAVLTPNYDRLVEVACETAGFHVDTTALGHYAGCFDHERSCMASCRGIVSRGRATVLEHFPRAVVLKPHGSFDWYRNKTHPVRSTIHLDLERLIITPGLNKYRAGYDTPFDKHRELANNHINGAARLLIVGYGFNDDHLQTHLEARIRDGTPTVILTRTATRKATDLAESSPSCVCVTQSASGGAVSVVAKDVSFEREGPDLWGLGVVAKEVLG